APEPPPPAPTPAPKVTARPIPETPPVAPAVPARQQEFVPPALIEHGISLQDDEARDAMGWVNWLQSQGAQQHGAQQHGAQPQSAQTAPPQQATPNGVTEEANLILRAEPPSNGAGALRAMFAELGPTPGGESETERLARVKDLAQQPDGTRPDGV